MEVISATEQFLHQHMMLDFSLPYSTILWWKVANILCNVVLIILDNTFIIIANICIKIDVSSIDFGFIAVLYVVAYPPACGPPCGGIRPTPASCVALGPMYPTRKSWLTEPLPSKYGPKSGHLLPPYSRPELAAPTYI